MLCSRCNAPLQADAAFCEKCGTQVHNADLVINNTPTKFSITPEKKKKYILWGSIGVVLLITIILILFSCSPSDSSSVGFTSAEEAAEAYFVALYRCEFEEMLNCCPDFYIGTVAAELGLNRDATKDEIIEKLNNLYASLSTKREPARKIDILSCSLEEKASQDDLQKTQQLLDNLYGEYVPKITDAAFVHINAFIDNQVVNKYIFCVKTDGRWFAVNSK